MVKGNKCQFVDLSDGFTSNMLSAIIERYAVQNIKHRDNVLLSTITNEGNCIQIEHSVTKETPVSLDVVGKGVFNKQRFPISTLEATYKEITEYLKDLSLVIYLQQSYHA